MSQADDAAIKDLCPHNEATHIAIADGDWTNPATWFEGTVPRNGARVLTPFGRTVTYDNAETNVRLDWLRVDGTLNWAIDQDTDMLVETIVSTRGSTVTIGTEGSPLPSQYKATTTYSGRDYQTKAFQSSDLQWARDNTRDPKLWSRGWIMQGHVDMEGADYSLWHLAQPIDAGATSLTLLEEPTNWAIGDTIVIGGTLGNWSNVDGGNNNGFVKQDEERVLTDVSGSTLSWSGGLTYPHKNQLVGSNRTDLYPVVMRKRGKNIRFSSEVQDDQFRRAHMAMVHGSASGTIRGVQFVGMGRTSKFLYGGKLVNNDTELQTKDPDNEFGLVTEPKTARSNIFGRYHMHWHLVGGEAKIENCYGEDSDGWIFTHHDCRVKMNNIAGHLFYGAAIAAEQGSEIGEWTNCLALGTTYDGTRGETRNLSSRPKTLEIERGRVGDNAYYGGGFFNRGRATRNAGSYAVSCTHGHVWFPREDNEEIQPTINPLRVDLPIQTVGIMPKDTDNDGEFKFVDYPIIGFSNAVAIGCGTGMFVTKEASDQKHDWQVHFKKFKSWGHRDMGAMIEYVGVYILEDFDCVAGFQDVGKGVELGINSYQIGAVRVNTEGHNIGVNIDAGDIAGYAPNYNNAETPRHYLYSHTSINDNITNTVGDAARTIIEPDLDNSIIDTDLDPTESQPLEIGTWDGAFNSATTINNTTGSKSDNIGSGTDIWQKPNTDPVIRHTRVQLEEWNNTYGHWTYLGNDTLVIPYFVSDRLTGRHAMYYHTIRGTAAFSGTNNGTWSQTATPVTGNDFTKTTPVGTSISINVVTDAGIAGGSGSGYAVWPLDFSPPNNGDLTVDSATNVTYTPDTGYSGTDKFEVFVESEGQLKTIEVSVLVGGTEAALETPASPTHFDVTPDGTNNAVFITLGAQPDADGRYIKWTHYTTDGGVTWRRVCNSWIQNVIRVTEDSGGTALVPGAYTFALRYGVDHDRLVSGTSAGVPVTVGP